MGYTYKEITHEAKEAGLFNEKKAYEILCDMSEGIEEMALTNKEEAWALKRRHYQMLFGPHYNEAFAIWQVAQMYHKDSKTGMEVRGQHWSPEQVKQVFMGVASKNKAMSEYNYWDFYVTIHMMWHDNICMYRSWWPEADEEVLTQKVAESAVNYLTDDDGEKGKIWMRYASMYQ